MRETLRRRVEAIDSPCAEGDPQPAAIVLGQAADEAPADAARRLGMEAKDAEFVPVVSIQPVVGAEPEEALAVLQDRVDEAAREAVVGRDALERRSLGARRIRRHEGRRAHEGKAKWS